jgi:hypothetical protein
VKKNGIYSMDIGSLFYHGKKVFAENGFEEKIIVFLEVT